MTPLERDHVQRVWQEARRAGRDPYEELDRRRLLLTRQRYLEIRTEAFYQIALKLENLPIGAVLKAFGAGSNTAYDAQRVLTEWIRSHARREEEQ